MCKRLELHDPTFTFSWLFWLRNLVKFFDLVMHEKSPPGFLLYLGPEPVVLVLDLLVRVVLHSHHVVVEHDQLVVLVAVLAVQAHHLHHPVLLTSVEAELVKLRVVREICDCLLQVLHCL